MFWEALLSRLNGLGTELIDHVNHKILRTLVSLFYWKIAQSNTGTAKGEMQMLCKTIEDGDIIYVYYLYLLKYWLLFQSL